jgi:hypothetical protein
MNVSIHIALGANLRRQGTEQHLPSRVAFIPDPVAWSEVPDSLRVLGGEGDR